MLGARARPRRRPQRHPRAAARQPRSACRTATSLGLRDDVVLDVDVTRNRPDCWSLHRRRPRPRRQARRRLHAAGAAGAERSSRAAPVTTVEIVDGDRCGRFTSTVIGGVAVGPSAPWMAERLTAAGMRPINNVVDVSNYVMLELGQPNHAYDLATLGGGGFRIRLARDGEEMTTLDGVDPHARRRPTC